MARAFKGDSELFTISFRRAEGAAAPCEVLLIRVPIPGQRLLHVRFVDIARRIRADQLRDGQARVLELVARGAPLEVILDNLMLLIEGQSDGVLCSVLLLDEDGVTVRPASGPSLPPSYMAALNGLQIGPAVGSCGSAMFRNEIVIVPDIEADPRWAAVQGAGRAAWPARLLVDADLA